MCFNSKNVIWTFFLIFFISTVKCVGLCYQVNELSCVADQLLVAYGSVQKNLIHLSQCLHIANIDYKFLFTKDMLAGFALLISKSSASQTVFFFFFYLNFLILIAILNFKEVIDFYLTKYSWFFPAVVAGMVIFNSLPIIILLHDVSLLTSTISQLETTIHLVVNKINDLKLHHREFSRVRNYCSQHLSAYDIISCCAPYFTGIFNKYAETGLLLFGLSVICFFFES